MAVKAMGYWQAERTVTQAEGSVHKRTLKKSVMAEEKGGNIR